MLLLGADIDVTLVCAACLLQTTLCGSRTETRVHQNGACSHQGMSPYHQQHEHHPLVTPQHGPRARHAHCAHGHAHHAHGHAHHGHTHLTPLLVNAAGQTSVLRPGGGGGDLSLPPSRSLLSYRRLDGGGGGGGGGVGAAGEYTSSSAASQTNSDRSHTYESIGDGPFSAAAESLRNGMAVGGGGGGGAGGGGMVVGLYAHGDPRMASPLLVADPDFCDCECSGGGGAHLLDFDPAGVAVGGVAQVDGYYSDRGAAQTLPIRHFRHLAAGSSRDQDSPFGSGGGGGGCGPYSFDIEDSGGGSGSGPGRSDSRLSNRSRRRTSSGSHYSDRSFGGGGGVGGSGGSSAGGYREGGLKRNIPALHPNYFDPPEPPAPDTFKS